MNNTSSDQPGSSWTAPPTDVFADRAPDTSAPRHLHSVPAVPNSNSLDDQAKDARSLDSVTTPVDHPTRPVQSFTAPPETDVERTVPIPAVPVQRPNTEQRRLDSGQWTADQSTEQFPPVVSGELVLRGDRLPVALTPRRVKRPLSVLFGWDADPELERQGLVGLPATASSALVGPSRRERRRRTTGRWVYESAVQARQRRDVHDRARAHRAKLDNLRVAIANVLGTHPLAVRMFVPMTYDDPSTATGFVQLKFHRARQFNARIDPPTAPRLKPVRVDLPDHFPVSGRQALIETVTKQLPGGGEWAPVWRDDVYPARVELHRLPLPTTELGNRIRAICGVLAGMFALDPWAVDITVPEAYANRRYGREEDADPEPEDLWLDDPDRPEPVSDGIEPVRLVLPDDFPEAAKGQVKSLISARLGGEWSDSWKLTEYPMTAEFTRKLIQPRPPKRVDWELSDDPYSIFVGRSGKRKVYVNTQTETPHWAVSAGSGGGKTTTLMLPAIHYRAHGGLVDIIDMKQKSFAGFLSGVSGFRVHSTTTHAVAAMGEFLLSAMAVDAAKDRGFPAEDIPARVMLIDEFGSFVKYAEIWWRDVLGEKGKPPVKAWFHVGLMQGRTKNHRFVVGTHDFSTQTFDGTGPRDLLGNKILIGPISNPRWVTTFGYDYKKVKHQAKTVGRAVMGITGTQPEEVQLAYAGDESEVNALVSSFAPAPAWFDRGEMPPWVTDADISSASEAVNIAPFLPGGDFVPSVINLATQLTSGTHVQLESSGLSEPRALAVVRDEVDAEAQEAAREVGFRQAMTEGLVPDLLAEVRGEHPDATTERLVGLAVERLRNARKNDPSFPEPASRRGPEKLYRVSDLRLWMDSRRRNAPTGSTEA